GSLRGGERLRRLLGAAVLAGVAAISLGLDTGLLARLSSGGGTQNLEQTLLDWLEARPPRPASGALLPEAVAAAPGPLAALSGATGWLNSATPLSAESLRGKVVLVDFWTYSCINCLRALPYVRAWAEKYQSAGLVVLGVHTPEFAFEKQPAHVRRAVQDLRIGFPVALDSDYAIWRGFDNRYWPALYFIDAQGRLRHQQFGEGGYEEAERVIQRLLAEAGASGMASGLVAPQGRGVEAPPAAQPPRSGETYLGHARASGFASPSGLRAERPQVYALPAAPLRTDQWALSGSWTVDAERAVLQRAGGRIAYRFHARDLHLVLGPGPDGRPVRFRVRVDGQPPLADHGADIDAQGQGTIDAQRLYQLLRQPGGPRERLFEIEFLDPGAQAYAFTFG
ncbi:MAG TPA: thioredoxin family protein, partial [Roseateles sp.]|nr:thioredoxin family protein [Roseateles sp.]